MWHKLGFNVNFTEMGSNRLIIIILILYSLRNISNTKTCKLDVVYKYRHLNRYIFLVIVHYIYIKWSNFDAKFDMKTQHPTQKFSLLLRETSQNSCRAEQKCIYFTQFLRLGYKLYFILIPFTILTCYTGRSFCYKAN